VGKVECLILATCLSHAVTRRWMAKRITLAALHKAIKDHDAWEKSVIGRETEPELAAYRSELSVVLDKMDQRTHQVEQHIVVLNKEMGLVSGQLESISTYTRATSVTLIVTVVGAIILALLRAAGAV